MGLPVVRAGGVSRAEGGLLTRREELGGLLPHTVYKPRTWLVSGWVYDSVWGWFDLSVAQDFIQVCSEFEEACEEGWSRRLFCSSGEEVREGAVT